VFFGIGTKTLKSKEQLLYVPYSFCNYFYNMQNKAPFSKNWDIGIWDKSIY
jgi:hypothetical protein